VLTHDASIRLLCEAETLAMALGDHRRLAHVSSHMAHLFRVMGIYDHARTAGQHEHGHDNVY
jgi:hypothetical protein